jgi:hypothetical protein
MIQQALVNIAKGDREKQVKDGLASSRNNTNNITGLFLLHNLIAG